MLIILFPLAFISHQKQEEEGEVVTVVEVEAVAGVVDVGEV